ncbi:MULTISPECIES: DUF885 domain-containing protein [Sphingobium]|jgi:uncharacterized protein (DUF885 family)|uniref:DUF885 domain-containing protein n=1 Tax=Sphingobium TaxID=165695 RepID=UPI000DBB6AF1|nr:MULTISPECIES: DUF885 domain-containing protein [Sphingobium]KAA9012781.1 DUF885 domain-containing protein [Sphingobium limneticum]MBU0931425.1 DUF885 domain-containing protein [Alphaproteobacteria bacterium]BBC99269.1 hypothetical protein YGS_C1P0525 [Sphingobium sp. YG1]
MDRRQFLATSGAAALAAATPRALAQTAGADDARLSATFAAIFDRQLDLSPAFVTSLGLDKGGRAGAKSQLDDNSKSAMMKRLAATQAAIKELEGYKTASLSDAQRLNLDVILYALDQQTVAPAKFGLNSAVRPYRIFQQGGSYFSTPDFLNTAHTINATADCDAYVARLEAFARNLRTDTALQRDEAARGYLAPGWSLDLTLGQMKKLRSQSASDSSMVQSLVKRAAAKGLTGDWQSQAAAVVEKSIYPALDEQIAAIESLRGKTAAGDGIWRTPRGDEIYAAALKSATTTDLSADQIHAMGLEQVADLSAQLDVILKGAGRTSGSIGERLAALNVDPAQLYPDSAEGRAALLAQLNRDIDAMKAKLPNAFTTIPDTALEIRAVPVEIQDGASNGYYNRAALDGSRPAIYFINLKDVGDWPKYGLPSLTYHEGVPGHHLQISTAQNAGDVPMLRKTAFMSAYTEGWALYAEQLADELGGYATPIDRAGYLQSFLFRAARLVVDTGIHAKKWDVKQATDYMVEKTGFARPRCQREVERYCTQPGQATSYKVGHGVWSKARQDAQASLGKNFDIKQFHAILEEGAMPLSMLEKRVAARAKAVKG